MSEVDSNFEWDFWESLSELRGIAGLFVSGIMNNFELTLVNVLKFNWKVMRIN